MPHTPLNRSLAVKPLSTLIDKVWEDLKHRKTDAELPIGLSDLDEKTRGYRRGKVSIIGARTSDGKTVFALNSAVKLANKNKAVLYISLEDDVMSLAMRILCHLGAMSFDELDRGQGMNQERYQYVKDVVKEMKILLLDNFGYNFHEISHLVRNMSPRPEIIFIDYIQMIDVEKRSTRYECISAFMRDSKVFALKENISLVLLCQVNRSGAHQTRPQLHQLKEAGTIEEVADLVLLLKYPLRWDQKDFLGNTVPREYYEIEIAKNKTGKIGICKARFIAEQMRFEEHHE